MNWLAFLHYLLLSIWVGGISVFSFVVAPAAFRIAPTRELAGKFVGEILRSMSWVQIGVLCALFVTSHFLFRAFLGKEKIVIVCFVVLLVMTAFVCWYSFLITPEMQKVRDSEPNFYELDQDHPARITYRRLHATYVRLMAMNLLFGVFLVGASVHLLRK